MLNENRPCDSKNRKKDRYTRKELENLVVMHHLPISSMAVKKMSMDDLCKYIKEYPEKHKKKIALMRVKKQHLVKKKKLEQDKKKKYIEQKKKRIAFQKQKALVKKLLDEKRKARQKEEKKKLELAAKAKAKKNCVFRSLVGLRDYQKNVVRYMNKHDRFLVYHKMGTGKTITAVTVSQCYLDKYPNSKVIVVSPASLLDNFKKGMMEYGNIRHKSQYEFYSIQKCTSLLKQDKLNCEGKLVIIDEVHNYKADIRIDKYGKIITGNNIFEGYKCFLKASKLLLLTGTPLYNRPIDVNLYKVLLNYNPETMSSLPILDLVKYFKKEPIETLKCKLSYYSVEKNDKDFPARINKVVKIPMLPAYEKEYKKILAEIKPNVTKEVIPKVFSKYKSSNENQFLNLTRRATQNIDNNTKLNRKLFYVKDLIEKYDKRNQKLPPKERYKLVIYSQFKDHGINLIKNIINVPYGTISGDAKVSERARIVKDYNDGKITILFITKAGGEGLDLKGTDAVILMEPTWNDNSSEQVIARAIRFRSHEERPESRKKVRVYRLCHVAKEDLTSTTQKYIKKYIKDTKAKVPKIVDLANNLISCDLIMEVFQEAKQNVLNLFDVALQKLSIENNSCS